MPNRLRDFSDFNVGNLNNSKNGYIIRYNASQSKYELTSPDNILSGAAADADLPDQFVDVISSEVDVNNIALTSFDGGQF